MLSVYVFLILCIFFPRYLDQNMAISARDRNDISLMFAILCVSFVLALISGFDLIKTHEWHRHAEITEACHFVCQSCFYNLVL